MEFLDGDIRELRGHFTKYPIPEHVCIALRVRFGDHREASPPGTRKLERKTQNPLDASSRMHGGLQGHFMRSVHRQHAAVVDVLPFGILAYDDEVDRLVAAKRAW